MLLRCTIFCGLDGESLLVQTIFMMVDEARMCDAVRDITPLYVLIVCTCKHYSSLTC